ncbi:MAG: hypothetical protein WED34_02205 [Planctomycetales bacterium]
MPRLSRRLTVVLLGIAALAASAGGDSARSADHTDGFDDARPTWQLNYEATRVKLLAHRRHPHLVLRGDGAEHVQFEVASRGADGRASEIVQLGTTLPAARVIDELNLELWLRSNRPGAVLSLRVVLPKHRHPDTGAMLTTYLNGAVYTTPGQWQKLECRTADKAVAEKLRLLRAQLRHAEVDPSGMYVDRVVLTADLPAGAAEFTIDELRFGPVVSPQEEPAIRRAAEQEPQNVAPLDYRLDRLSVQGRPFFPRFGPYHGEDLDLWEATGCNLAWIPDYEDYELLAAFQGRGLWTMATPPRVRSAAGEVLDDANANLVPFSSRTYPILIWYGGTRVSPAERRSLEALQSQVWAADRNFRRPMMVDVNGDEREFSRQVSLLGVSRHVLHTNSSLMDYREWLMHKRRLARPGSFVWTWVQTEPAPANTDWRNAARRAPAVVEPEQLRLQVYAALSAGCRGIGFWNTTPLDSTGPGAEERRLALTQLNLELELLEPWLATGSLVTHVPFELGGKKSAPIGQRRLDFQSATGDDRQRQALIEERLDREQRKSRLRGELEAAIIRSDHGILLLPVWYEHGAQFCPGQMVENNATIIVPGVDEAASAWEVTTTGIRSLERTRVTGGIEIKLPKFDQTTAIILSADQGLVAKLRTKADSLAAQSAAASVALARAKLARVRSVDDELRSLNIVQPDAPQLLVSADALLARAEAAHRQQDHASARLLSADAMQLMRILQRAHWNSAVRSFAFPTASPYAICFQTLPDHWRLVEQFGRNLPASEANLLRSGDFEDIDTMVVEGWKHTQNQLAGVRATAELHPAAHTGKYCLRLVAVPEPGSEPPSVVRDSPVEVTTPAMPVVAGQILFVTGWIRIPTAIQRSPDGVVLTDSIGGPVGALRWKSAKNWQRFELIREVRESGEFQMRVSLAGLGEVQLDELKVVPHDPRAAPAAATAAPPQEARGGIMDYFNRLPRLNPLAPRR